MKRLVAALALTFLLLTAVACGSSRSYTVQRNNGPAIISVQEPSFDKKSDTYKLVDMDGNDVIIKRENVVSIQEHKR